MKTRYQLVDSEGSWRAISADGNEEATLFDSYEEAEAAIPELAACLECDEEDFQIIEREPTEDDDADHE